MGIGQQLIQLRARRRITQQELADRAGISVDVVRKLEQQQRQSARLATVNALALALDVQVGQLLDTPRGLTEDVQNGEIQHLRKALLGALPDVNRIWALDELDNEIRNLWGLYYGSHLAELARQLPAWLATVHQSVDSSEAHNKRRAHSLYARTLNLTANLLGYVAHEDLAALALHQAQAHAEVASDALTLGTIQASRSWLLTKHALFDEAAAHAEQAAAEIEPRLSTASPQHIAIWGDLLCYATFSASHVGACSDARGFLRLAQSAAAHITTTFAKRPEESNVFGPALASGFAVVAEVADEQPRRAIDIADRTPQVDQLPPLIYGRHLVNLAHAQVDNWDNMAAVNTLRRAQEAAPELVPHVALTHTLTSELLSRSRKQRLPGVRTLAQQIGLTN